MRAFLLFSFFRRCQFTLLLVGLSAGLGGLTGCGREEINAQYQSGVWKIRRVAATDFDPATGSVTTRTEVTDAGEVAFVFLESLDSEARFYLDKPVPSRVVEGGGGTHVYSFTPEEHERRRILLTRPGATIEGASIFTITEDQGNTQRWEQVRTDNDDRPTYRENWEVERVK